MPKIYKKSLRNLNNFNVCSTGEEEITVFSLCPLCLCGEGLGFTFPGFQNEAIKELMIRGPAGRGVFSLLDPGQESIHLRIQVIQLMEEKCLQCLGSLGRAESIFSMVAEDNVFQPEG